MENFSNSYYSKLKKNDIDKISRRDVTFRRCFGNVKINSKASAEGEVTHEFGDSVDSKDFNEDTCLSRECNNFDLITLDSSQQSVVLTTGMDKFDSIHSANSTLANKLSECDQISETYVNEIKRRDLCEENAEIEKSVNSFINYEDSSGSHSSFGEATSDNLHDFASKSLEGSIGGNSHQSYVKENSFPGEESIQECEKIQSCNFLAQERLLKPDSTSYQTSFESSALSPEEGNRSWSNISDDVYSEDSNKWNKHSNNTVLNACYYVSSENPVSNQYNTVCSMEMEPTSLDADHILNIDNSTGYNLNEESCENISENSSLTSNSASSTFESAMSSNDMMSPFGSPRNSASKYNSVSYTQGKKSGINYASLTSENIPNTLNKIMPTLAAGGNDNENLSPFEPDCNEKKVNVITHNKLHSSHSIRKLLNLTCNKKLSNSTINSEPRNTEKLINKKDYDNYLFSQRNNNLGKPNKKLEMKEFYTSRRYKIERFSSEDRLKPRLNNNSLAENENKSDRLNVINNEWESATENKNSGEPNIIKTARVKESKNKFVSKIPRPISRKDERNRTNQSIDDLPSNYNIPCHEKDKPLLVQAFSYRSKSEKTDIIPRLSHSSNSFDKINSNCKNKNIGKLEFHAKMNVKAAQIDDTRSKCLIKEDQVNSSKTTIKKQDPIVKSKEDKKNKFNFSPFVRRQENKLPYAKIMRVRTAPIKSTGPFSEKSILKDSSKFDNESSWKLSKKPTKVVSIPSLDIKKKN